MGVADCGAVAFRGCAGSEAIEFKKGNLKTIKCRVLLEEVEESALGLGVRPDCPPS
jgi:hypothetical protein